MACDDDSGPGQKARLTTTLDPGVAYIVVDGYEADDAGMIIVDIQIQDAMLGYPTWRPVGIQHFTGPVGTPSSSFTESIDTLTCILSPGHAFSTTHYLFAPATAHDPPYDGEMAAGVSRCGRTHTFGFTPANLTMPSGIFLIFMLVPEAAIATIGSSPDFSSGPILENALFPIRIDADLYRGGALIDADFDSDYPSLTAIGRSGDGYSHVPILFSENDYWFPSSTPLPGAWEWRVVMIDAIGNSWSIQLPFTVE